MSMCLYWFRVNYSGRTFCPKLQCKIHRHLKTSKSEKRIVTISQLHALDWPWDPCWCHLLLCPWNVGFFLGFRSVLSGTGWSFVFCFSINAFELENVNSPKSKHFAEVFHFGMRGEEGWKEKSFMKPIKNTFMIKCFKNQNHSTIFQLTGNIPPSSRTLVWGSANFFLLSFWKESVSNTRTWTETKYQVLSPLGYKCVWNFASFWRRLVCLYEMLYCKVV